MRLLFKSLFLCKDSLIARCPAKLSGKFMFFIHSFVFEVAMLFIGDAFDVQSVIFIEMVDSLTCKFVCALSDTTLRVLLFSFHPPYPVFTLFQKEEYCFDTF